MSDEIKYILFGFDLETTGLNVFEDLIIEICIAPHGYDGTQYMSLAEKPFRTHVSISQDICVKVTQITGIDKNTLKNAPPIVNALQLMSDYIQAVNVQYPSADKILVGYNLYKFDLPLLINQLKVNGFDPTAYINSLHLTFCCDPLIMAKHLIAPNKLPKNKQGQPSYKLGHVYEQLFGKVLTDAHSAVADVEGMLHVLEHATFHQSLIKQMPLFQKSGISDFLFHATKFTTQFLNEQAKKITKTAETRKKKTIPCQTIAACLKNVKKPRLA